MGVKKNLKYQEAATVANEAVDHALTTAAVVLQEHIIRAFGTEGGRVVGKTATGRNIYVAAAVGRFPGIRSGRLRQSVYATPARNGRAAVGTSLKHGKYLERGTRRMGARPWLYRSFRLARDRMARLGAQAAAQYIRSRAGGAA
jgi:hypothetical protein